MDSTWISNWVTQLSIALLIISLVVVLVLMLYLAKSITRDRTIYDYPFYVAGRLWEITYIFNGGGLHYE